MTVRFPAKTKIETEKSLSEIKRTVQSYGADQFASFEDQSRAAIIFTMNDWRIRFDLPLPVQSDPVFLRDRRGVRSPAGVREAWLQGCRRKWNALAVSIKAKLDSVESGIETFEEAFLANVVLPDGSLLGDHASAALHEAYTSGQLPPLLSAPPSTPEGDYATNLSLLEKDAAIAREKSPNQLYKLEG